MISILALALFSCESDDPEIVPPSFSLPSLQPNTYVLSYNNFLLSDDVIVASEDTTFIEVNIDYLINESYDIGNGDVLVIWRAFDEVPFIRQVIKKKNTRTVLRLETRNADFGSVFQDADIELSTALKLFSDNPFLPPHERYTVDNVCHPAAILTHLPSGEIIAKTAKQMMAENPDWNILTAGSDNLLDTAFIVDGAKFEFSRSSASSNVGVDMTLTVENTLLRRFECASSGISKIFSNHIYHTDTPVDTYHEELFSTPTNYTLIYWAGEVPLAITVNQETALNVSMNTNKPFHFSHDVTFESDYRIGSNFRSEWRPVKDISLRFQSNLLDADFSTDLEANTLISVMNVYKVALFDDFFSDVTVGYSITSDWTSAESSKSNAVKSSALFAFGGLVNNNNSIANWQIPMWNAPFNVVSTTIWNRLLSPGTAD